MSCGLYGDVVGGCEVCGAPRLLDARWCSRECRRAWTREHVWAQARQARLARDGWECQRCGAPDWLTSLEVHHLVPVAGYEAGCDHHLEGLATLCVGCHRADHRWLRSGDPVQLALAV